MSANVKSRKLSSEVHRKLSAISNCSDVSNISVRLGMDQREFRNTISNILELDVGDAWELDSDDGEMSCYGDDPIADDLPPEDIVTIKVDKRKISTASQVSCDSLDSAETFEPVKIDLPTVRSALNLYQRHKKISMSRITTKPLPEIAEEKRQ